jgi:hypothetical protein
MDIKSVRKVRDIIADEIVGCTFKDLEDAKGRVEDILEVLESAGVTWSIKEPPPH